MNITSYKQLIQTKEIYNNTEPIVVKMNMKRIMKQYNIDHSELAALFTVTTHTIYSYSKKTNKNKPDLYNLMILASYLNINIDQFFTNNSE